MTTPATQPHDDACGHDDCTLLGTAGAGRREFLRGAGAALGALALLGLSTEEAMALPVRLLTGTRGAAGVRYPIPAADSVIFDDKNGIIIVRRGAQAWAFLATCPHKDVVKLKWQDAENRFKCPKHDSTYQPDGTFIEGRATRNMDRLPIKKDGTDLVVDVESVLESDKMAAGWKSAVAAL